jgi:hypothetical protein
MRLLSKSQVIQIRDELVELSMREGMQANSKSL